MRLFFIVVAGALRVSAKPQAASAADAPKPKAAIYQKVPWYTAVVQDRWKFIRYLQPGVADELYDLGADPEELNNLAADPKQADRLDRLRGALGAELKRTAAPTAMRPPAQD